MDDYCIFIIFSFRHSNYISIPVVVIKKKGEIHLYVDFKDLNTTSMRDNYPLPKKKYFNKLQVWH